MNPNTKRLLYPRCCDKIIKTKNIPMNSSEESTVANYHLVDCKIRTGDFDCRKKLQPAAILDYFQDVAGEHAIELGVGRDDILAQNLVWVVVRVRFKVLKDIPIYSNIKVRTWPLESNRVFFRREYVIENESGEECVLGSSEWVLMHTEKRRIVPAKGLFTPEGGFLTRKVFDDPSPRIRDFESENEGLRVVPRFSHIDVNGHVNNTKYANFILDASDLSDSEIIDTFQIEYHREILKDTPVFVHIHRENGEILARGENSEKEKMFSARITLK